MIKVEHVNALLCLGFSVGSGLEKIPISQGLVTLLHNRRIILTLQLPISPETPR